MKKRRRKLLGVFSQVLYRSRSPLLFRWPISCFHCHSQHNPNSHQGNLTWRIYYGQVKMLRIMIFLLSLLCSKTNSTVPYLHLQQRRTQCNFYVLLCILISQQYTSLFNLVEFVLEGKRACLGSRRVLIVNLPFIYSALVLHFSGLYNGNKILSNERGASYKETVHIWL